MKRLVIALHLSEENVIRVKIPLSILLASIVISLASASFYIFSSNERQTLTTEKKQKVKISKEATKVVTQAKKEIEKVKKSLVFNTINQKDFLVKDLSVDKKTIKFFLTKRNDHPGIKHGIVKVKYINNNELKTSLEEKFKFKNGRLTTATLKGNEISKFLIQVIESNEVVLQQQFALNDERLNKVKN